MSSERPEYNDKIEAMHALAPVAYVSHNASPTIRVILPIMSLLKVHFAF